MITVKFLVHQDAFGTLDLFAFFPGIEADDYGNLLAYSHVGQHSACRRDYAKESVEATKNEYEDLLQELESIGYDDLLVINEDY